MENYLLQNSKLRNMLKQLCRDTPISGYGYVRFAKDNPTTSTHIYSTNNDWTEYKLKQKFTIVCPSTVHYGKIWQYKMVPRLGDKLHERCMDAGEKFFQIYHPIDIIHNVAGNIEVHAFAVNKPGTDAVNCYLNEMELLQYFAGISSIFMHEQLELDKPKPQLLTENQVPVTYTSKLDIMERIVALHLNKSPSFSKSEKKVIY
ncbi:MAG: hypothetical protein KAT71_07925, partial [Gammaproteobacteria bacterium]|nr:hypothetical protein [Gammaproteobacteria bacterium]